MYEGIKEQYISESILLELLQILRVLNWAGGNYYLVGPTSIGKTTTLQLAARLSNVNVTIWHPLDDKRAS